MATLFDTDYDGDGANHALTEGSWFVQAPVKRTEVFALFAFGVNSPGWRSGRDRP
jgi:hypothetical protein